MVKRMGRTMMLIGTVGFVLVTGDPELAPSPRRSQNRPKSPKRRPKPKHPTQSL